MKRIGLVIALALFAWPANAQGVLVEGVLDCGQWVAARTEKTSSHFEQFVLGFINGFALGKGVEFWQPKDKPRISRESVYLWMDSYCQKNPLVQVLSGAIVLYKERSGWQP